MLSRTHAISLISIAALAVACTQSDIETEEPDINTGGGTSTSSQGGAGGGTGGTGGEGGAGGSGGEGGGPLLCEEDSFTCIDAESGTYCEDGEEPEVIGCEEFCDFNGFGAGACDADEVEGDACLCDEPYNCYIAAEAYCACLDGDPCDDDEVFYQYYDDCAEETDALTDWECVLVEVIEDENETCVDLLACDPD